LPDVFSGLLTVVLEHYERGHSVRNSGFAPEQALLAGASARRCRERLIRWLLHRFRSGVQINVASKAGEYGGLHHESRLRDCGVLTVEIDPMFSGILGYGGGQVKIANEDGVFDDIAAMKLYGQVIKIRYGEEGSAIEDFALQYGGLIEDFLIGEQNLSLDINDARKRFTRSVPPASTRQPTCT
jgi:hypothetical protein